MPAHPCAECGATEGVKPAREYPHLAALLENWGSLAAAGGERLCPDCAARVAEEMSSGTVRICRLDPTRPAPPD